MRIPLSILAVVLTSALAPPNAAAAASPPSQPASGVQVDIGIFYDDLAPYGDWVEMPDYGWTFAPRVDRNWRPYTQGQWVWTDDGWYWDSDERFGWAAYHYGRWVNDRNYGWVWIPDTEWAPAWVSWRHGNGYTGWAPLPPRATWRAHLGLSLGGLDIDAFIGERDYAFVPDRSFVDRGIYQRVLPSSQNVSFINVTNNITNYVIVNQRVINRSVTLANVEQAVGHRITRMRTIDADRADAPRRGSADQIAIFRPQLRGAPGRRPAQGRSLVQGEAPPAQFVERRQQHEQERQQRGNTPDATARDVQQRRPSDRDMRAQPVRPPQPQAPVADPKRPQARDRARPDGAQQSPRSQPPAKPQREAPTQADQPDKAHPPPPPSRPQATKHQDNPPPTRPEANKHQDNPPPASRNDPKDKGDKKAPKPKPTKDPLEPGKAL